MAPASPPQRLSRRHQVGYRGRQGGGGGSNDQQLLDACELSVAQRLSSWQKPGAGPSSGAPPCSSTDLHRKACCPLLVRPLLCRHDGLCCRMHWRQVGTLLVTTLQLDRRIGTLVKGNRHATTRYGTLQLGGHAAGKIVGFLIQNSVPVQLRSTRLGTDATGCGRHRAQGVGDKGTQE